MEELGGLIALPLQEVLLCFCLVLNVTETQPVWFYRVIAVLVKHSDSDCTLAPQVEIIFNVLCLPYQIQFTKWF